MNRKAILLVRVSTLYQDYSEQEAIVRQAALADGFSDEQIISIKDKESAIKLTEEQRHGLNEMKQYIETDSSITCVYVFALDRISRRNKVLYSIIDYLETRRINLIILNPARNELFNKDYTINQGARLFIGMFAMLAQAEMENKKARFKRSKDANKRLGRYNGGQMPEGYIKDENGFLIPDPNNFIVDIFNLYRTGKYSHQDVAREMQDIGHFQKLSLYSATKRITAILNDRRYYGEPSRKGIVLPALITKEMFDECAAVGKSKRFIKGLNVKKVNDRTKMLKGLIYCTCGRSMYVNESIDRYVCTYENFSVIKSVIDRCCWFIISPIYSSYLVGKQNEDTAAIDNEISSLYAKINVAEKDIKVEESKIDRINSRIIDLFLNEARGNEMILQIKSKIRDKQRDITGFRTRISELEILKSNQKATVKLHNVGDIFNIQDVTVRYDICHEIIDRIVIDRMMRRYYEMTIRLKTGQELKYRVNTQRSTLEVEEDVWVKV